MNKGSSGKKFGRMSGQRRALFKSLARGLILAEKITTTNSKAIELRKYIEPIVTRSRIDTVAARRHLAKHFDSAVIRKLFLDIGPRYRDRKGGYTKVIKRVPRKTDSAKMAIIKFV